MYERGEEGRHRHAGRQRRCYLVAFSCLQYPPSDYSFVYLGQTEIAEPESLSAGFLGIAGQLKSRREGARVTRSMHMRLLKPLLYDSLYLINARYVLMSEAAVRRTSYLQLITLCLRCI